MVRILLGLLLLTLSACGGGTSLGEPTTSVQPQPGDYREMPNQIVLFADMPATIYYTTDGTEPTLSSSAASNAAVISSPVGDITLKYFAVNEDGDQEPIKTADFKFTPTGPAPVRNLTAETNGTSVTLSWQAPDAVWTGGTAPEQYIVARTNDSRFSQPVDGVVYNTGGTLPDGSEIIYVGNVLTRDVASSQGGELFGIYAQYPGRRYSTGAFAFADVPLTIPSGTIGVTRSTGSVVVTQNPVGVSLEIISDSTDGTGFYVRVQNDSQRVFYHPRLFFAQPMADGATLSGPNLVNSSYYPLGLALVPGQKSKQVRVQIEDMMSTGKVDFAFQIRHSLMAYGDTRSDQPVDELVDINTDQIHTIGPTIGAGPSRNIRFVDGQITEDGRYVYVASATSPSVSLLDVATWGVIGTHQYDTTHDKAGFASMVMTHEAVYGVLLDGVHTTGRAEVLTDNTGRNDNAEATFYLVKIDRLTLREESRVEITPSFSDAGTRAKRMAISPDGSQAAIPVVSKWRDYNRDGVTDGPARGNIVFVDLPTMSVDGEPLDITTAAAVSHVTYSANGSLLYGGAVKESLNPNDLVIVELGSRNVSSTDVGDRIVDIAVDDSIVYLAGTANLYIYNGSAVPYAGLNHPTTGLGLVTNGNKRLLLVQNGSSYDVVDTGTDMITTTTTAASDHTRNWFVMPPY